MVSKKNIYIFFSTCAVVGLVIYLALLITKKTKAKNIYSITDYETNFNTTTLSNTFSSKIVNLKINKTYNFYCIVYFNILTSQNSNVKTDNTSSTSIRVSFDDAIVKTGGTVQPFYTKTPQLITLQTPTNSNLDFYRFGFILTNEIITVTSVNGFIINISVPTAAIPTNAYVTTGTKFSLYFTFEETTPTTN